MAQLANVSLMFTAHHCAVYTLTRRNCVTLPCDSTVVGEYHTDKQPIFPLVLFSHGPLPARSWLSRMHAMDLVCGGEGGRSFPPPRSSMYPLASLPSTTLRPLSISSTNLVTMTNKNRKRGCPLNYLHYFVGEEVETALDRAVQFFLYSLFFFLFLDNLSVFLKEYIGSKTGKN